MEREATHSPRLSKMPIDFKSSLPKEVKNQYALVRHPILWRGEVEEDCIKTTWGGFSLKNIYHIET
jgi:hypothetical protein